MWHVSFKYGGFMPKKPDSSQKTKREILDIATELFAKKGFDGTSTRDICKAAGVNISMISYYFGGKEELYSKVVSNIVENIIQYILNNLRIKELPKSFDHLSKEEKISALFKFLDMMMDYFYSDKISDSAIMIIFREQMTSGVPLNAEGYKVLKRLLASILDKDENDKEIIFRTLTIVGQIHSAKILKQFSLKMMNQSGYSKEDIQMLKKIIMEQVTAILKDLGVRVNV